jgi:two-component system LytT family response regulator
MSDTRPLRTLIVDDEELARNLLREYLGAHEDVEIAGECANGFDAVKAVAELRPDLLFLDIQMPKLDGFEVLELIDQDLAVVFVTAHDQHALRAFQIHAVDYLLKPYGPERLAEALQQARLRIGQPSAAAHRRLSTDARRDAGPIDRVLIKDQAKVHVIPVDQIDYVEALDDYVCLHVAGKKHLKSQTLAEIEGELDAQRFVRIHRSFLLNLDRLARLELYAKDSRVAFLQDGTELPVSRSGYSRLKERM